MKSNGVKQLSCLAEELLTKAQALDRSSLHRQRFNLAGLRIDAWFCDPDYTDLCSQNLAQVEGETFLEKADFSLFLLDSASLEWEPPPRWADDVFDRRTVNSILSQAGLNGSYLHDPRFWQFYSPSNHVGVQLIRRPGMLPPWETGAPLRTFLHWAYMSIGWRLCHAATLGLQSRGILLVGSGGSGKSGTALAGVAAGLQTVGDDYCLINPVSLTTFPLYRILKENPSGVSRVFGTNANYNFGPINWQGKHEIHASVLPFPSFTEELKLGGIFVPRVAGLSKSRIRPISPGRAMCAFAPSSAFQLPDGEREAITFAADLCRRLPCMEIQLSENAEEIAATIRTYLENECL